jgi:hypothetical protein
MMRSEGKRRAVSGAKSARVSGTANVNATRGKNGQGNAKESVRVESGIVRREITRRRGPFMKRSRRPSKSRALSGGIRLTSSGLHATVNASS